jgi:hypothetical protein
MKCLFILLSFLLCSNIYSQQITKAEYDDMGKVFFQRTDSISKSKDLLYAISKEWISNTFRSGKAVIDLDDKDNGKIIGKGSFDGFVTNYNVLIHYHFTIKIETKNNKVRFTIYDIYTKGSGYNGVEKAAEFWFGPLCKKCTQDVFDQHQSNIIKLSEMLRANYFKAMNQGVDLDW